ncbi:hypothetical protein TRIATDRAFT_168625, partial [Trichoderma atroviride IMI 206040]
MAVLGKRKAPEPTVSSEDAQEIFRRHFEAQFLPIEEQEKRNSQKVRRIEDEDGSDDSDGSEDNEWDGVSGDELSDDEDDIDDDDEEEEDDAPIIEVVDHSAPQTSKADTMSKRELKAFMSSRPPDQSSSSKPTPTQPSSKSTSLPEDAPSLLAQDLELRRLISESHLLQTNRPLSLSAALSTTSTPGSEPKTFSSGRVRQKALDLRIQALGSKTSIHKQEKMPMHMRKGITAAAVEREAKRRREAKESGVILERETGKKQTKRDRRGGGGGGGFGPAVGRLKGAELRISERDVKKIEGTRDTFGRRG